MAQPNSQMLVTRLQDIGTGFHDIAHQVSLTTNIPAMNQGDQLLQQMQQLQTQMQQMQQQNQTQMQQMQLQNQTQMQQLQTEMRTGFQGINDRIDLTNARIDSMYVLFNTILAGSLHTPILTSAFDIGKRGMKPGNKTAKLGL